MERSLNGSKIILRFNEELQAVGDGAGLLSGILGALGSDYSKFPICEKSWAKVRGKDRVYDDCIKDSSGLIKKSFLKQMGKSWKDTRGRLFDSHYKPTRTLEQNLEQRPEGIPRKHWKWFIEYRNDPATKAKCKQNTLNRKKQLYTHTGGSKSLARAREEELEQLDESTRILSENDSLAQALGKEHPETQRMLCELQAEVTTEKLKTKAIEDELAAEKTKRQEIESVLSYLVQQQCGELPPDIAARMNSLDRYGGT
ncbi:hypothetical protein Ahy_B09g096337 isoform H [Arachis hypogaea]|uniref:Uncharacterized protein n=1 Tax=Arachis hypogaea TaxID=3818 RepID=A0A444XJZ5_ARAHY|nr:hypothetical protein Ahy_B09g096337 isoform H [Arachis hypogaea]